MFYLDNDMKVYKIDLKGNITTIESIGVQCVDLNAILKISPDGKLLTIIESNKHVRILSIDPSDPFFRLDFNDVNYALVSKNSESVFILSNGKANQNEYEITRIDLMDKRKDYSITKETFLGVHTLNLAHGCELLAGS